MKEEKKEGTRKEARRVVEETQEAGRKEWWGEGTKRKEGREEGRKQ